MSQSSSLSGVLHVLLHMAEARGPVTSETLAGMMQTNPVVIRRLMAGLRQAEFVRSEKGHGGGWMLARDLAGLTLLDIYNGIGAPALFAITSRNAMPDCAVELAVNEVLATQLRQAEALLLESFAAVTLASLSENFHRRLDERRAATCHGDAHEH